MRPLYRSLAASAAVLAAAASLAAPRAAHAQDTYLAIGDSWAFGYSTAGGTVKNTGYDPAQPAANGYVGLFAQTLDARNGASPLNVVNLARPGEAFSTVSSFSSSTAGPNNNQLYNTRYDTGAAPSPTQIGLLQATLAAPGFADSVKTVTIQLGGNDVLGVLAGALANPDAWNGLGDAGRQAAITNRVNSVVRPGMTNLVGQLRAALPNANIYIVGYSDLFTAIPGSTVIPFTSYTYADLVKPYTQLGTQLGNAAYQDIASGLTGVQYVDVAAPFAGQEASLSRILTADGLTPNFHPNEQGYQVVASRLAAASAAVPEAGTVGLLAAGSGGGFLLLTLARRRRRATSVLAA